MTPDDQKKNPLLPAKTRLSHSIIIIIRIYYGAAQPVLSTALQYNNVIVDSGNRVNHLGLLNK